METVNPFPARVLVHVEEAWLLGVLSTAVHHHILTLKAQLEQAKQKAEILDLTQKLCYAEATRAQLVREHVDNHLEG